MFARRPRFDDTYGVRMDLGADRIDPMSLRPSGLAGQLRVKAPVLVQQPWSIFRMFEGRSSDPFAELRERKGLQSMPDPSGDRARPEPAAQTNDGFRRFESGLLGAWRKMSVQKRIFTSVAAGWILLGSGLFIPAIVIAGIYLAVRRRAA